MTESLCGAVHPDDPGVTCTNKPHPWGYHLNFSDPQAPVRWDGEPRPERRPGKKPFPSKTKREGRVGPPDIGEVFSTVRRQMGGLEVVTNLRKTQHEVLDLFSRPMTDEEMIQAAHEAGIVQSTSGLRTRRSELVDLGLLRDSGLRGMTINDRPSIKWERASVDPQ